MTKIVGAGGGGGGKGGGGGGGRTPSTAPDSLDSKAFAKVLDLLSEGEIQGLKNGAKSIFLNNTQLQNDDGTDNFSDVLWVERKGSINQDYIPLSGEVSNEVGVGVVVTKAIPVVRTITDPTIDAARVTITIPTLQSISNEGDVNGATVQLKIYTKPSGGAFTEIDLGNSGTITGRTGDAYQRAYVIPLSGPFPVNIKVERVTDDSTDPKLTNAFNWTSYTEITYAKLKYPYSALVGLRVNAEQFNTIPSRSYLIRGIKVRIPQNATVDSTTGALIYSGVWDGTFKAAQWTSDPAWCLYDLLTSQRYGFGDYLLTPTEKANFIGNASQLDKWAFYQASVYCSALNTRPSGTTNDYHPTTGRHGIPDGLGNYEPRFSCNINIQTQQDAYRLINDMCSVFRAMPFWSAGSLTVAQDAPGTRAYMFSLSNVTEEGFSYSGSSQKTRSTVALVKYFDTALRDYAYEAVEDQAGIAKYGVVTKEIEAFACTSRGQAHRLGEWLLYSETYETEVVSFTASIEAGVVVRPGQIIAIADPVKSGVRRGGRVKSGTTTVITVDDATSFQTGSYSQVTTTITVTSADHGLLVGSLITLSFTSGTATNGSYQVVTVPTANTFTVTSATSTTTSGNVTLLGTNPNLYLMMPDGTIENKVVSSIVGNVITVSSAFSVAPNPNTQWLFQNDAILPTRWRVLTVQEQDGSNYAITALAWSSGKYDYIERGVPLQPRSITTLNRIPNSPSSLTFEESLYTYQNEVRSQLTAMWLPVPGVSEYEVQWRKDKGNWNVQNVRGPLHEILNTTPGLFEYRIYSLNSAKLPSSDYLSGSTNALGKTAPPAAVTGLTAVLDPDIGITLNWNKNTELDLQGYEIWQGASFGTGTKIGLFQTTSAKVGLLPTGTVTWYIKALDTSGVYSTTAASVSVTIGAAAAPTVTGAFKGTDVELRWNAVIGSLSTQYYEIRYGSTSSTWETATATVAGTVQGTVFTTKATWSGVRRWFVAAVDLKGNYGTAGTADTQVNVASQPSITQQVIDNNVLLQWRHPLPGNPAQDDPSPSTLPIESYELRKGNTWATATVIGTKQGRFTSVFEVASGTYTYWLAGIDSAGNYGTPGSVTAVVNQPPDYQLKLNQDSSFTPGTRTNVALEGGRLVAAVNTTETWQQHFTTRGWNTPQDQINAGHPIYALPSATSGTYEEIFDTLGELGGSKITAALTSQLATGSVTITPRISVRRLVTDPWTDFNGVSEAYATLFRYVKVRYDFASAGNDDLLTITNLNVRIDAKLKNEFGNGFAKAPITGTYTQSGTTITVTMSTPPAVGQELTAGEKLTLDFSSGTATDDIYTVATVSSTTVFTVTSATSATTSGNVTVHGNGQPVFLASGFVDVQAISVTPATTSAVIAVYDFVDVPNPTSFKVLLFNTSGTRVSGTFSWSARGV